MLANVKHGQDIGMVQRGNCAGFLLKSVEATGIASEGCGQEFECDIASQARVRRVVDLSHPAGTDQGFNFVRSDLSTCR